MELQFIPEFIGYEIKIDEKIFKEKIADDGLKLYYALEEIKGVESAEYNEEFGPYIYVTLDTKESIPKIKEEIKEIIKEHIE